MPSVRVFCDLKMCQWRPDAAGWLCSRTTRLGFRAATITDPNVPWDDLLQVMDLATGTLLPSAVESAAAGQAAEVARQKERAARQAAERHAADAAAELVALKARFGLT